MRLWFVVVGSGGVVGCGGGPPAPVETPPEPAPAVPVDVGGPAPGMPTESTRGPDDCEFAFTPDNANEVYTKLGAIAGEGCAFEGVATQQSTMVIKWKDAETIAEIHLRPDGCVPQTERTLVRANGLALLDTPTRGDRCQERMVAVVAMMREGALTTPSRPAD